MNQTRGPSKSVLSTEAGSGFPRSQAEVYLVLLTGDAGSYTWYCLPTIQSLYLWAMAPTPGMKCTSTRHEINFGIKIKNLIPPYTGA